MILMDENRFLNKLKKVNLEIFKDVKVIELNKSTEDSLFNYKYGNILLPYGELFRTKGNLIRSAVNKTDYWVTSMKEIREDFENIDYSKVKYKGLKNKVALICKIHDYSYNQRTSHHSSKVQGCPKCAKQVIKYSKENFKNHVEFFKDMKGVIYVVEIIDNKDIFYKVGITKSDRFEYRINQLKKLFDVSIVFTDSMNIENCFNLEQKLLQEFNYYKHTPKIKFSGYTECLKVNPIEYYYN